MRGGGPGKDLPNGIGAPWTYSTGSVRILPIHQGLLTILIRLTRVILEAPEDLMISTVHGLSGLTTACTRTVPLRGPAGDARR